MRSFILISGFAALISCTQTASHSNSDDEPETGVANVQYASLNTTPATEAGVKENGKRQYDSPVSYYTGMFEAAQFDETKNYMYANKITISVDSLKGDKIFGHSVVAGNKRSFTGAAKKVNSTYEVTAKEPGDDKYDGIFYFTINGDYIEVSGEWIANDKNLAVTKRTYTLQRREFSYEPALELPESVQWDAMYGTFDEEGYVGEKLTNDVFKFNASTILLKSKDVSNMYKADIEVMRNAIYARHGYSFKNRRMRYVFDNYVDWYMPVSTDVTNALTEIEKKNIDLLKRFEDHASKYYDSFGR
ncbi:MAG: YARHG domain-containing protein [Fimbriimonadaceae bacterium]|nr:YARHG domain-containing protein [Chitinophagales bacterium]